MADRSNILALASKISLESMTYTAAPVEIIGKDSVKAVRFEITELGAVDASGRPSVHDTGEYIELPASDVISEVGQTISLDNIADFNTGRAGTVVVDPLSCMTRVPGVFAGGDVVTGRSSRSTRSGQAKRLQFLYIASYIRGRRRIWEGITGATSL